MVWNQKGSYYNGKLSMWEKGTPLPSGFNVVQHLYFTSDEIKEGDWYIDDASQVRKSITSNKDWWLSRTSYKKIIACTDPSLKLPLIPQSFLREYVKHNGDIESVELELDVQTAAGIGVPRSHPFNVTSQNEVIVSSFKLKSDVHSNSDNLATNSATIKETEVDKELDAASIKSQPDYRIDGGLWRTAFKAGAKWQEEKSGKKMD